MCEKNCIDLVSSSTWLSLCQFYGQILQTFFAKTNGKIPAKLGTTKSNENSAEKFKRSSASRSSRSDSNQNFPKFVVANFTERRDLQISQNAKICECDSLNVFNWNIKRVYFWPNLTTLATFNKPSTQSVNRNYRFEFCCTSPC